MSVGRPAGNQRADYDSKFKRLYTVGCRFACATKDVANCRTGKRRDKIKKKTGKKNSQAKQSTLVYVHELQSVCSE